MSGSPLVHNNASIFAVVSDGPTLDEWFRLMEVPAIDLTHSNTPTAVTQLLLAKLAEYMSQMLATHLPPAINSLKWVGLVLLMMTAAFPQR